MEFTFIDSNDTKYVCKIVSKVPQLEIDNPTGSHVGTVLRVEFENSGICSGAVNITLAYAECGLKCFSGEVQRYLIKMINNKAFW